MSKCSRCQKDFSPLIKNNGLLYKTCDRCRYTDDKYRDKHKEQIKEYREANKEQRKEYDIYYRELNKDILTNLDYIINTQNSVYVRLSKYGKYNLEQYSIYNNSKILYRNYGNNENQICLISTGPISYNVYLAIRNLNLNILHIHIPFVKNLDSNDLIKLSQNSNMIYIFEEHSVIGGLYSLCSEIFIKSTEFQKKQIFNYGINDCFIHKYGSQEEIWEQLYLDSNSIKKIILNR